MTRFAIVLLLFALGAVGAEAQSFSLGLRVGVERYALGDLRSWQDGEIERVRYSVPAEELSDFPAYLAFGAEIGLATSAYGRVGLSLRYGSTGGRHRYADRSGVIGSDWEIVRRSIGLFGETAFAQRGPYVAVFSLHALVDFGRARYESVFVLGDEMQRGTTSPTLAKARTYSVEPEVGVERQFGNAAVRLRAGFGVSTKEGLSLDALPLFTSVIGGGEGTVPGSYASQPRLNWTGWRFGLTLVHRP